MLGEGDHAQKLLRKLQGQFPTFTDLFYMEAQGAMSQGDSASAKRLLELCMKMGDPPSIYPSWGGTGSWRAKQLLDQMAADS